jgi:hypothetical protein
VEEKGERVSGYLAPKKRRWADLRREKEKRFSFYEL